MKKRCRLFRSERFSSFLLACCLVAVLFVSAINATVVGAGKDGLSASLSSDKQYDCILVLGAGLRSDGSPSDMLRDRLRGAVELYRMGVSDTILLSGDRSGEDYDEVSAMAAYCLAEGIPENALVRDFEGYSTYESVAHAVEGFEYDSMMIVTQEYHVYRALYTARQMGVEADGFAADYHTYRGQIFRDVREVVARVKDFWQVTFS